MTVNKITPIILCGGSGTRLWPLSRAAYPKQLLSLLHEPSGSPQSLLQQTLVRLQELPHQNPPILICNQDYRFIVAEQVRAVGLTKAQIFLEPEGKNTAPAVTIAALSLQEKTPDDLMLVLPADHVILDPQLLAAAVEQAAKLAQAGHLVTFGVVPTKAETAYGYIQKGEPCAEGAYQVKQFVEKPDALTAAGYLQSGNYFWNSGMFLFSVTTYLSELEQHAPDILAACRLCLEEIRVDLDFHRIKAALFKACRSESLDYALMEKAQKIAVVPLASPWSDVGSWSAIWEVNTADASGNVVKGDVVVEQVNNSYLHAESRLLAVVGVSDLVVVETADAVLVTPKAQCQDVKVLVNALKKEKRREVLRHHLDYRPWGHYEILSKGNDFQAKRLVVKPGAKLSLQMHQQRSEHWVVIKGTAFVTKGEEQFHLEKNQSTFIPAGVKHRLENRSATALELIEVQTGSYLGEDDIVRFEDMYQRSKFEEEVLV